MSFSPLGERLVFPLGTLEVYRMPPRIVFWKMEGIHPTASFPLQKIAQNALPPPELSSGFGRPWEKLGGRKAPA